MTIRKCPETMSAKERVRRTFAHEKTDRVTIGYDTNPAIHARLARALGIPGGYHFAPTHDIQDHSPTENVIAMYQAAHDLGRY